MDIEQYIERIPESGCWLWIGTLYNTGYGKYGKKLAHRYMYEQLIGPIPSGLCIMHKCDVRCCVNPHHLAVGTLTDNNLDCRRKGRHGNTRKTQCPRGHPLSGANLYRYRDGRRECRTCQRDRNRENTRQYYRRLYLRDPGKQAIDRHRARAWSLNKRLINVTTTEASIA